MGAPGIDTHVRRQIVADEVSEEFVDSAFAFLDASENLNSLMINQMWPGSFNRGKVVLWLAFHSVELFLKGCILERDADAKVNGHSLFKLNEEFHKLAPEIEFVPPFGVEEMPPEPEIRKLVEEQERRTHEVFRYPTGQSGEPWSGAHMFSSALFAATLKEIRQDFERIQALVFVPRV